MLRCVGVIRAVQHAPKSGVFTKVKCISLSLPSVFDHQIFSITFLVDKPNKSRSSCQELQSAQSNSTSIPPSHKQSSRVSDIRDQICQHRRNFFFRQYSGSAANSRAGIKGERDTCSGSRACVRIDRIRRMVTSGNSTELHGISAHRRRLALVDLHYDRHHLRSYHHLPARYHGTAQCSQDEQ